MSEKRKKVIAVVMAVYTLAVVLLGFVIHGDFPLKTVQDACFAFVILNLITSLIFAEKSAHFGFCFIALLFTVFSDRILTYNIMELVPFGVTLFTFTQVSYFFKSFYEEENTLKKTVLSAVLITVIFTAVTTAVIVMGRIDYLTVIALTYLSFLVISCIFAFTRFMKNPLFAVGLLLFIGCDLVLGIQVVGVGGNIGAVVQTMDCWWFYYPSQILIIFSMAYRVFIEKRSDKNEQKES